MGMYGIGDKVYLSLPCVLNSTGVGSSADMLWHIQKDL
uniref:Lactate/malate dehydrogenase C-terminal domain-containing protein n=1 Tax=Sinocyclocheilus grahami TaxID=75366 RepID=A0A672QHS1_SINGR